MPLDIRVEAGALDLLPLRDRELSVSAGAVVTFTGVVRNQNHDREVVALDYDCAPGLAQECLLEIGREAILRWGCENILMRHAHGYIAVGDASVFIMVTAMRRDAAFEACRYMIEETKKRVPVWKREVYADGEAVWLEGTPLAESLAL